MLARLGEVFGWLGTGIAWLCIAGAAVALFLGDVPREAQWWTIGVAAVTALVSWLIGRAARYVLAGR